MQGYRDAPPGGIGAFDPAVVPGGDGAGTTVVDVEYSWVLDHEDLELDASANIDTQATLVDPFNSTDHGTAVLGELAGVANAYGVTGIVPATTVLVAPANTNLTPAYNPARAITLATGVLDPGDAILIEQQTGVCGGACGANQVGCGPLEGIQAVFDAIAAATALGITVVEAAGNGNVNLDAASCAGLFDRTVRDSGAIIVGAGDSATRARLAFSSYGSRVDLQGWGNNVTTTGYGDLFNPGDVRQRHTGFFSGTSSASPIVTGAALAIQGAVMEAELAPLDPLELRQVLVDTGTPQTGPAENIGPLPDIGSALAAITGEIDHFLLYAVDDDDGQLEPVLILADQFESAIHKVDEVERLGNPVDKNGEGISDPDTHLVAYEIDDGEPEHEQRLLRVTNQFGELLLETDDPEWLLVPSLKSLDGPIPDDVLPDPFPVDHFKCYEVELSKGAKFKRIEVSLQDQFMQAPKQFLVLEPAHLCNPVDKAGEGIQHMDDHLVCYELRRVRHKRVRNIYVNNQFGPLELETERERELCVPSTKEVLGFVDDDDHDHDDDDGDRR